MNLFDIEGPKGADNTPGLRGYIAVALEDDFTTLQAPPPVGGTPGASSVIANPHVFAANKGFAKIYITLDSNQLKADISGERDGRGVKVTFEGFVPGNAPKTLELMRQLKNQGVIMLVPDADGNHFQVGARGLPCELAPSFDSGKLSSGRRGFTIKGECYATGLVLYSSPIEWLADA